MKCNDLRYKKAIGCDKIPSDTERLGYDRIWAKQRLEK